MRKKLNLIWIINITREDCMRVNRLEIWRKKKKEREREKKEDARESVIKNRKKNLHACFFFIN